MDIGTGIFFGCLFLGLVFLFVKTRNIWRWKKIICISIAIPICLAVLIAAWINIGDYISNRPQILTSLDGINLNDSLSDVLFKNSKLTVVEKSNDDVSLEDNYFDGNHWIAVKEKKVSSIGYICNDSIDFMRVNSISCGDSSEKIITKFGKDNVRILCDNPSSDFAKKYADQIRAYDIIRFGTRFVLNSNKVQSFSIIPLDEFKQYDEKRWKLCK